MDSRSHPAPPHDTTGDDLGFDRDPAPNVEPGDVLALADGGRCSLRLASMAKHGPMAALLQVVVAPSRLDSDDTLP
jgi:hypothetical protein